MLIYRSIGLSLLSLTLGLSVPDAIGTSPESSSPTRVEIPTGAAPTLDGTLSADEWKDALVVDCEGDSKVYFKHDGTNLYIGINAPSLGVANVYLRDDRGVHILHASGALGSVLYTLDEDLKSWNRTNTFDWQVRTAELTPEADRERMQYLDEHGWVAPNISVGPPNQYEFIIKLERLGLTQTKEESNAIELPVKMAICYTNHPEGKTVLRFPSALADDCTDPELQSGDIADVQHFDPETWATLVLK